MSETKYPTDRITEEEASEGKLPEWTCRVCRKTVHPSQLQGLRTGQLGICHNCVGTDA
jgi:hypothetical protein